MLLRWLVNSKGILLVMQSMRSQMIVFWRWIWTTLTWCLSTNDRQKYNQNKVRIFIYLKYVCLAVDLETQQYNGKLFASLCRASWIRILFPKHSFHNSIVTDKTRFYSKFFTWFNSLDINLIRPLACNDNYKT